MSGFGSQHLGSSPFGIGDPVVPDAMPGRVYRDKQTGEAFGARLIDPVTKDYVYDENGRALGMSGVLQQVQLAVSTESGSSAMRELGHELGSIDVITPSLEHRVDTTLRAAVAHLVAQQVIEVLGVTMFMAGTEGGLRPGQAHARFRFKDLTTGQVHGVLVG